MSDKEYKEKIVKAQTELSDIISTIHDIQTLDYLLEFVKMVINRWGR